MVPLRIFCLKCLSWYKTRRRKWYDMRCPSCNNKPVLAFAYDRDVTVVDIIRRLIAFHFGDDVDFGGDLRDED